MAAVPLFRDTKMATVTSRENTLKISYKRTNDEVICLLYKYRDHKLKEVSVICGLRVNSPWGEAEWAIDPWPLRAKGLIVLVSPS